MQVRETRFADIMVLEIVGAIDQDASPELETSLLRLIGIPSSGMAGVLIDLAGVPYVGSASLRALMIAAMEFGKSRSWLALAGPNPCVRKVFQISRFDKVIPTFDRVGEALGSISPQALGAFNARPQA